MLDCSFFRQVKPREAPEKKPLISRPLVLTFIFETREENGGASRCPPQVKQVKHQESNRRFSWPFFENKTDPGVEVDLDVFMGRVPVPK